MIKLSERLMECPCGQCGTRGMAIVVEIEEADLSLFIFTRDMSPIEVLRAFLIMTGNQAEIE